MIESPCTTSQAPLIGISRHRLSIDGEGVTTLVAFHGCPLRCRYCLNPTSLRPDGVWKRMSPGELYDVVRCDELYFLASGGGITFGGGEPMLQSQFISQFRQFCGQQWRITLETSLHIDCRHVEQLLPVVDSYIVDIKDANPDIYRRYTGCENDLVIANLRYLVEQGMAERITVRTPLIPAYNTEEDVAASTLQLQEMGILYFDPVTYQTSNTK